MKSKSKSPRPLTDEVRQFANLNREGDVIPHGWNKHIGRLRTFKSKTGESKTSWRSRPFAERLLARVVWLYTPTPIKNSSGDVIEWRRKFDGPYWRIDQIEMAEALGCSRKTIVEELALLRELGLVRTEEARTRTAADGGKHMPIYVIPIYAAIIKITGIASNESLPVASNESLPEPVTNRYNSSVPSSVPSSNGALPQTAAPSEPEPMTHTLATQLIEPDAIPDSAEITPSQSTTYGNSHDLFCLPAKNPTQRLLHRLSQSGAEIEMVAAFLELLPLKLNTQTAKANLSAAREILYGDGTIADMKRAWLDSRGKGTQRGFTVTDLHSLKNRALALAAERKAMPVISTTSTLQPIYN